MIYVPMLKIRQQEKNIIKEINHCFNENIIPLFEIVKEEYIKRYKKDPITGEFLYQRSKNDKKREKIPEEPTVEDIYTLEYLNEIIKGKKAFIDYFRFVAKNYGGNKVEIQKVALSNELNNNTALYKEKLLEISNYKNFIPVISLKPGYFLSVEDIISLIKKIKNSSNSSVALRLTDNYFTSYKSIIEKVLTENDYLLFDIGEQPILSKTEEIELLSDSLISAKIIVTNSPRRRSYNNGDFPENGYVKFIDNSAMDVVKKYNLDGFSDYCGYKDVLPLRGGSNGKGSALIVFFDYKKNQFYSLCEHDTSYGVGGYIRLKKEILEKKTHFDPTDKCIGYKKILKMKKQGSWKDWNNVCIRRYISEIYYNQNDL